MGTWSIGPFDNDSARDFVDALMASADWSELDAAIDAVLDTPADGNVDTDVAVHAIAACEIIARIAGLPGPTNLYAQQLDAWLSQHPAALPVELFTDAAATLERIVGPKSELRTLKDETDPSAWLDDVADLKARLLTAAAKFPDGT